MSAQLDTYPVQSDELQPTASERARLCWGVGKATVTLLDFAEQAIKYPERDDSKPEYDDKFGNITLGYN